MYLECHSVSHSKLKSPCCFKKLCDLQAPDCPKKLCARYGFFSPRLRGAHRYTIAWGRWYCAPCRGLSYREKLPVFQTGRRGRRTSPSVALLPTPLHFLHPLSHFQQPAPPAVCSISSIICLHSHVASAADRMRFSSLSSKR